MGTILLASYVVTPWKPVFLVIKRPSSQTLSLSTLYVTLFSSDTKHCYGKGWWESKCSFLFKSLVYLELDFFFFNLRSRNFSGIGLISGHSWLMFLDKWCMLSTHTFKSLHISENVSTSILLLWLLRYRGRTCFTFFRLPISFKSFQSLSSFFPDFLQLPLLLFLFLLKHQLM